VADHASGDADYGGRADQRAREQDPDEAPTAIPVHAPCWVGFACFSTWTLPSASLVMIATRGADQVGRVQLDQHVVVSLGGARPA
jgi:hypothetical protein